MAGVYFANTKPILTCGDCPFNDWNPGAEENCGFCSRIGRPVWDDDEPYADCRIVNVPDHGKLIDADTLADRLEKDRTFILHAMMEAHKKSEGHTREDYLFDRNGDMISMLRNQAAVIPADRKEGEA